MSTSPETHQPIAVGPDDAARLIGIGRSKLYELLSDGVIPSVKIGTRRVIPVRALAELVGGAE